MLKVLKLTCKCGLKKYKAERSNKIYGANSVEEQIMSCIVLALWARGFPSRTEIRTGDASNFRLPPHTISSKKLPAALDIPSIIRQNEG